MSLTPDRLHGGRPQNERANSPTASMLVVIAWIVGIVLAADVLYAAHRYLG